MFFASLHRLQLRKGLGHSHEKHQQIGPVASGRRHSELAWCYRPECEWCPCVRAHLPNLCCTGQREPAGAALDRRPSPGVGSDGLICPGASSSIISLKYSISPSCHWCSSELGPLSGGLGGAHSVRSSGPLQRVRPREAWPKSCQSAGQPLLNLLFPLSFALDLRPALLP